MALRTLLPALALAAPALALVHEAWTSGTPKGWAPVGTPSESSTLSLTIALTMQNIDQLESKLLAVSTPGSPSYGAHLDAHEVASLFAPAAEGVEAVTAWLKAGGVSGYTVSGAFIDFAADVSTVNALLNASYQHYSKDGVVKTRTASYSIPAHLQEYVALVDPGIYFGTTKAFLPKEYHRREESEVLKPRAAEVEVQGPTKTTRDAPTKRSISSRCTHSIDAGCLKEMYNVGDYAPDANSGSRVGFGSFLNQSTIFTDLYLYEELNNITKQGFDVVLIAGGENPQNATLNDVGEANLDVQNIVGVSHPLPVINYITGGSPPFVPNIDQPTAADNFNEPYVPYYRYLLSQPNSALPQVISNSYGDEEDSVPEYYARLTCDLIGIMGLRGITILESSGDLGVGAGCLAPDNKTVEFNAIFPATCPYITSVGGTVAVSPEIAWDGSSGGFSKYFPRPSWQDEAIETYLKTVSPETLAYYGPYTNWEGRGFPDVAGHSASPAYAIEYLGKVYGSGGTSAASPVWAGIVGMLNDARFRAGKKSSLGWLNPLLYAYGAETLIDITAGYSVGCNGMNTQTGGAEPAGSGIVPGARWNATVGWDTTTGWGTPDFQKLKELVLKF